MFRSLSNLKQIENCNVLGGKVVSERQYHEYVPSQDEIADFRKHETALAKAAKRVQSAKYANNSRHRKMQLQSRHIRCKRRLCSEYAYFPVPGQWFTIKFYYHGLCKKL